MGGARYGRFARCAHRKASAILPASGPCIRFGGNSDGNDIAMASIDTDGGVVFGDILRATQPYSGSPRWPQTSYTTTGDRTV
jgi:hypothetical protein